MIVIGFGLAFIALGIILFFMAYAKRIEERQIKEIKHLKKQIEFIEYYNSWKNKADKTIKDLIK